MAASADVVRAWIEAVNGTDPESAEGFDREEMDAARAAAGLDV